MNDIYSELQNVTKEIMGEFKQGEVRLVKITKGGGPAHNPKTNGYLIALCGPKPSSNGNFMALDGKKNS